MSYYHIDRGVRRKRAIHKLLLGFVCLSIVCFGSYKFYFASSQIDVEPNTQMQDQIPVSTSNKAVPQLTTPLPWPSYGQAAYGVPKDNVFASSPDEDVQVPIASLAKVITVLAILEKKPLALGEQGPVITLDAQDAALVDEYARKSGTYVTALDGQKITELQALQATLLVSANNISDSLARWAFGSVEAYTLYANQMLKNKGIEHTIVADASGFSPQSISTAKDMIKIGYLYMQHPVLRALAVQERATIPLVGELRNYNSFANEGGIIGIKIGNTDEAKRTFLAASVQKGASNVEEISIAVVLGAEDLQTAARDTIAILKAGDNAYDRLKKNL